MRKRPPAPGRGCSSGVDSLTADESEVADVLLHLPGLVLKSESTRCLPFLWGAKRRRTAPPPSSDSPELLPVTEKLDYLSNSPNSPLVFCSLANFDSKHAVPNKNEFKEAKGLELFTGDQLMTENIKLQDTRQQCVSSSSNSDSLELKLFNQSEPLDPHHHHHQQQESQLEILPDLNVPVEVYAGELRGPHHQKMEYHYQQYNIVAAAKSRAESAALARKRRLIIQKSKKKTTRGHR